MIISIIAETASDKIEYQFMIFKTQNTRNRKELSQIDKEHL